MTTLIEQARQLVWSLPLDTDAGRARLEELLNGPDELVAMEAVRRLLDPQSPEEFWCEMEAINGQSREELVALGVATIMRNTAKMLDTRAERLPQHEPMFGALVPETVTELKAIVRRLESIQARWEACAGGPPS